MSVLDAINAFVGFLNRRLLFKAISSKHLTIDILMSPNIKF